MKELLNGLRWTAFLPGAVATGWIAFVVINGAQDWALARYGMRPDSWHRTWIPGIMGHIVMGAGFVWAGTKIAPAQQENSTGVTTALVALASIIVVTMAVLSASSGRNPWLVILGTACTIVGAFIGRELLREGSL